MKDSISRESGTAFAGRFRVPGIREHGSRFARPYVKLC